MYKTVEEIINEGLDYLVANSSITYTADGSLSRALVGAMAGAVVDALQYGETLTNQSFLTTATGDYLDRFGAWLNLERLPASPAFVVASDRVIRFYVESGTLYQYLSTGPTYGKIPKGTRIEDASGTITYIVTEDAVFDRTATEVYVSAIAEQAGTDGNIGAGLLTKHNLDQNVKVTNDSAISTGREVESDEEYRSRLLLAFSATGGNKASVGLAVYGAPGVSDFQILNMARGAGTFDVLVIPETNRLATFVKNAIEDSLADAVALGISYKVREPEYVPISLTARLIYKPGIEPAANLPQKARQLILDYLGRIGIGGWLIIDQLIASVLSNLQDVQDIKLDELIINTRLQPIADYKLPEDGVFVPDDAIPITVV